MIAATELWMFRLAFILTLLASPTVAAAVEVTNLYAAQTIVTGTEEPERTRGFRAGLTDVLVKLTGDARLAEDGRIAPLLEHPHALVEWFGYEDRMKGLPVRDEQGTRERPHFLRMRFKAAEVDQALHGLGLAKWPADRPVVAVRLVVETASGRYLLRSAGSEGYGQRAALLDTAERRGIPILLPGAAGEGLDSFEAFSERGPVTPSSTAGSAAATLAGVLSLGDEGYWDISWTLHWQERHWSWALRKVTFDMALADGLQRAALIFSGNY